MLAHDDACRLDEFFAEFSHLCAATRRLDAVAHRRCLGSPTRTSADVAAASPRGGPVRWLDANNLYTTPMRTTLPWRAPLHASTRLRAVVDRGEVAEAADGREIRPRREPWRGIGNNTV